MRLVSVSCLVLLVPGLALGAAPKEVEVINFPEPVEVQDVNITNDPLCSPSQQSELIGFTTSTHLGDAGVFGFTIACQVDFPGSHFCSSEEAIRTTIVPDLTGQEPAWLRPTYQPMGGSDVRDISGERHTSDNLSCSGWSSIFALGLMVDSAGRFSTRGCSEPHPIACCALVP